MKSLFVDDALGRHIVLQSDACAVVIGCDGGVPEIVSIGPRIDGFVAEAAALPLAHGQPDVVGAMAVVADRASGFPGRAGLVGSRPDGSGWSPRFTDVRSARSSPTCAEYELFDAVAELALSVRFEVADVLTISLSLCNHGATPYAVSRLAATVPMPAHGVDLLTFNGRWSREFQVNRMQFDHTVLVENTSGRTSHAQLPALFVGDAGFGEHHGEVWGVQLAWSGNYELVAEVLPDGRRGVQLGELLAPHEVELGPGETYDAPDVVVAWSPDGMNRVSHQFHRSVRANSPSTGPRPVVLNTWEAVYFNHDLDTLTRLADTAAAVGVERFVLDDGWFGGRRDDSAGLGDWWVSEVAWPHGLGPIVDHVTGLGMQFGLWVEPEMVNPESELFRAHPEWVLTASGYDPVLARNQLVLDFGRPDVRDHLFDAIDALLAEYDISSLKWDMNRDVLHGARDGRAGTHGHVRGVYELIDRLRVKHPQLEIESCASGGGRADLGMLRRTDRIWTSDCNDAVERQLIQRGCSMLFPPEVIGAHIGPGRAHTTGRRHDLGFRAATALFGQLGIEWNLLTASESELEQLSVAVALHRRWRDAFATGQVVRADHPDPSALVHGVMASDRTRGLFAYVQLVPSRSSVPVPVRLPGLDDEQVYDVIVDDSISSAKFAGRSRPGWMAADGRVRVTGAQLKHRGIQMPVLHPESALIFELQVVT